MPEQATTATETETTASTTQASPEPAAEPTASDLRKEMFPDEVEVAKKPAEASGEPETPPADEGDQTDEAETEADELTETDEREAEFLALDPEVAKAFPDQAKRWKEQVKGLTELRAKTEAQALSLENLSSWEKALADPKEVPKALPQLLAFLAEFHKTDVASLLGPVPAKAGATAIDTTDYAAQGWDSPGEMRLAAQLESALKAHSAEVAALRSELAPIKTQAGEAAQAKAEAVYLDYWEKTVQKIAEKDYAGFPVTRKMISDAIRAFPQLQDSPIKAVLANNAEAYAKFVSKGAGQKPTAKGPEEVPTGSIKGVAIPKDPLDYTVAHARAVAGV